MFWIWDIQGTQRPYVRGTRPSARPAQGVRSIRSLETFEEALHREVAQSGSEASNAYRKVKQLLDQDRKPAVLARQIMSAPVQCCRPDDTLAAMWELMQRTELRHLPVLDERSRLVGMLAERDILRAPHDHPAGVEWRNLLVRDVMSGEVLAAKGETPIREIAKVLYEERISALPIIDDTGAVGGILTRSDILRTLINQVPLDLWL